MNEVTFTIEKDDVEEDRWNVFINGRDKSTTVGLFLTEWELCQLALAIERAH